VEKNKYLSIEWQNLDSFSSKTETN